MRRLLAISLVLIFSLPLVTPLLASDAVESHLPACCRRTGQHHCAISGDAALQRGKTVSIVAEKCPCPPAIPAVFHLETFASPVDAAVFAEIASHPAVHAQTEAQYRISFDRSWQKRGPPGFTLL